MSETPSLLHRVASGDQTAIEACMERYSGLVWSLSRRFTSNETDAEDAVQEIFIDLWGSARRFDPTKASETTFVAMLARRRLIDRMRKSGRQPQTEELTETVELPHTAPLDVATQDDASRAARLIRTLKPEQQQVIRLAVYLGHSHQSVADVMGLPLGTVKTHLRRGLLKVREAMRVSDSKSGGAA